MFIIKNILKNILMKLIVQIFLWEFFKGNFCLGINFNAENNGIPVDHRVKFVAVGNSSWNI